MSDYRDNFDMHPNMQSYYGRERGGYIGPLIAVVVILLMIAGVFFFSGGTGDVDGTASTTAPVMTSPATSDSAPASN